MSNEINDIQLPFSQRKQLAVAGHLLLDPQFFTLARHKVQATWFLDPIVGKIWNTKVRFYEQFQRIPSYDELIEYSDFVSEEIQIRQKMHQAAKLAVMESKNFGKDVIATELQGWLQAVMFQTAASQAKMLFGQQKFEDCYHFFGKELDVIKTTRFVEDREFQFENYLSDFQQELVARDNALTFGTPVMDKVLLDGNNGNGGLLPGDQTVILAPSNVGKSTALITTICANVKLNKAVLFMVHEGRPSDINFKLWQCMLGVTRPELFKMLGTAEGKARLDKVLIHLKRNLTFVHYAKAGMSIEDIEPIIRTKQSERIAKTGKGYDLFVCDYPAKLRTKQNSGGKLEKRFSLDIVYDYYVNYALEYNWHSIVAYQCNREGAKVNKSDDGRFLTQEDAAEAFGPMQTATNIITVNRSREAQVSNLVTFYVDKSRSSETGIAVTCKSNFACATTHSEEMGGVAYRATSSDIDNALYLMSAYPNEFITPEMQARMDLEGHS